MGVFGDLGVLIFLRFFFFLGGGGSFGVFICFFSVVVFGGKDVVLPFFYFVGLGLVLGFSFWVFLKGSSSGFSFGFLLI